ncbi:MAG: hypothetical protein WCE44_12770 [Candidatus Velthaea sp.]
MKYRIAIAAVLALGLGAAAVPAQAATSSAPFSVGVTASALASISVNNGTITCAPTDTSSAHFACSTTTATGSLRSSAAGSASLTVSSPAGPIAGTAGNNIPIASVQITCTSSGTGKNATPASLATLAALTASSTTACASWTTLPVVSSLNVLIAFFIDDTQVAADTYTTLTGFNVVATAT